MNIRKIAGRIALCAAFAMAFSTTACSDTDCSSTTKAEDTEKEEKSENKDNKEAEETDEEDEEEEVEEEEEEEEIVLEVFKSNCSFKESDEVWKFEMRSEGTGVFYSMTDIYIYSEKGSVDSVIYVNNSKDVLNTCKDLEDEKTEDILDSKTITHYRKCTKEGMINTDVTHYNSEQLSRQDSFDMFKKYCKQMNKGKKD